MRFVGGYLSGGLRYSALFLSILAAGGMVTIVGIIVTSVVLRKMFSVPLPFTEESVGILMSISLFLALPQVTLKGEHIRVSILVNYLQGKNRFFSRLLGRVALISGLIFCSWLLWEAWPWFEFAFRRDLRSETARILLWPGMLALPVSIFLTALILLARHMGWIEEEGCGEA